MRMRFARPALALAAVLAAAAPAQAGFVLVTSRSALAGTDHVDWAAAGPNNTILGNVFTVNSANGVAVQADLTGTGASAVMQRRTQGTTAGSYIGNFAPGDALLVTNPGVTGFVGHVLYNFAGGATAAGTQIQANNISGVFTARILAYSAAGDIVAGFDVAGFGSGANNNSAIFVGIRATDGDSFASLRLSTYIGTNTFRNFAINQLDFTPAANPVPAPPGLVLAASGLVCVVAGRRSVRRRAA